MGKTKLNPSKSVKTGVLHAFVAKLHDEGYTNATLDNVVSDFAYSKMLLEYIQQNEGKHPSMDAAIEDIKKDINK